MNRLLSSALAFAFLASMAAGADAKNCRDAKGKFVKCAPTHPMTMAKHCRDPKTGKFMKCKTK
jgi:hypothetical protein